eukprot:scaffold1419_cov410-Prasinococcus_capsulatus_cf.AAC.22
MALSRVATNARRTSCTGHVHDAEGSSRPPPLHSTPAPCSIDSSRTDAVLSSFAPQARAYVGSVEANLAHLHGGALLEIGPHGVHHVDIVLLVTLDRIRLHQLAAVLQHPCRGCIRHPKPRSASECKAGSGPTCLLVASVSLPAAHSASVCGGVPSGRSSIVLPSGSRTYTCAEDRAST